MFIGEMIKKYRTEKGLSQRAFAAKTSLSPSYINTLEKVYDVRTGNPISVTIDSAKEIAKAMNLSIEDLLKNLDKNQEFEINVSKKDKLGNPVVSIPILGIVKAGYDYLAQQNWVGTVDVETSLVGDGKNYVALKVKGDSMFPVLMEGDVVIVKKQNDFETGDIVIAIINGDEATIKKGKKTDNSILLQPFNTNYEPLIYTYEEMKSIPVTIFGIVKQLKREF